MTPSWSIRLLDRALGPFVDLRPGEGFTTLASSLVFFLVTTSYYLVKPVRNALFVERVGADNLPYVYIATALVVGVLIYWYARHVVDRLRPKWLIPVTYVFLAANLVLFAWLLRYGSVTTSGAFYIWAKLYPVLTISQFWLMMNVIFKPRQARRLVGFVGAGGILGGITGGLLAGATAEVVGTAGLLIASAVVITLCAGLALYLHPGSARVTRPAGAAAVAVEPARSAAQIVRESPHLRAIAVILTLTIIVSTVVDWQMNKAVELARIFTELPLPQAVEYLSPDAWGSSTDWTRSFTPTGPSRWTRLTRGREALNCSTPYCDRRTAGR